MTCDITGTNKNLRHIMTHETRVTALVTRSMASLEAAFNALLAVFKLRDRESYGQGEHRLDEQLHSWRVEHCLPAFLNL